MVGSRSVALAGAAALGAGVAYFLDPAQGRSRRARTRDHFTAEARRKVDRMERRARYERGRARGAWHEATNRHHEPPADDHVVVDKVRSELLGRLPEAHGISVDSCRGVVSLRGEVDDAGRILEIGHMVGAMPGVERVQNLLHLPGQIAPNKAAALRA